jgi:multicomponent Na+:H+ antiporter subunit E
MNSAFLTVILAIGWAGITGNFSGLNLLFGGIVGGAALFVLRYAVQSRGAFKRAGRILSLVCLFFWELMVSAIRVALVVVRPNINDTIKPAIVAVPLTVTTDAEIALLANLITLTPGTLSIDIAKDRSVIFVHVLSLDDADALIADIANGFEAKIKEAFR